MSVRQILEIGCRRIDKRWQCRMCNQFLAELHIAAHMHKEHPETYRNMVHAMQKASPLGRG